MKKPLKYTLLRSFSLMLLLAACGAEPGAGEPLGESHALMMQAPDPRKQVKKEENSNCNLSLPLEEGHAPMLSQQNSFATLSKNAMKPILACLPLEDWVRVGNVSQQVRNYVKEISLEEGHAYLPAADRRKLWKVESWEVVDRYEVRADASVLDRLTQLVWGGTRFDMSWLEAVAYCASLEPAGKWRLPTIPDLEAVTKQSASEVETCLPGMSPGLYFSTSKGALYDARKQFQRQLQNHWRSFLDQDVIEDNKPISLCVRVLEGQSQ